MAQDNVQISTSRHIIIYSGITAGELVRALSGIYSEQKAFLNVFKGDARERTEATLIFKVKTDLT